MPDSAPALPTVRDLKSADAAAGRPFATVLVIRKLAVKTAANGNPYLAVELGDRTGSFTCTVFSDGPAAPPGRAPSSESRARPTPTRAASRPS